MGEEMQGVGVDTGWRKAIPEARDRLQSRALVGVVGALLAALCAYSVLVAYPSATSFVALPVEAVVSTRAGRRRKARIGLAESRRGRSGAQVIANLSVAALSVSPQSINMVQRWMAYRCISGRLDAWAYEVVKVMCVAALVEATADTVSSEIGQAFGGDPVLIAGLRRVEPGTDGAVTLRGSCAGVAAGAMVAIAGGWAMHLSAAAIVTSLGAGIGGLFFDSLLGATVERRGWIGNDLVNFTSTLFAAALAAVVYRVFVH